MKLNLDRVLSSGQYSDLTITCQGQTFKVHRVMVATQSDVLARMINGQFKVY